MSRLAMAARRPLRDRWMPGMTAFKPILAVPSTPQRTASPLVFSAPDMRSLFHCPKLRAAARQVPAVPPYNLATAYSTIRRLRRSFAQGGSRMPRIRTLGPEEVGPEVGAMFERFQQQRGNIPNMFRTLAYRPEIALTAAAHMDAIFNTGTVDQRLKEMLAVRVSQINDCVYCRTSHTALAKKLGVSEALLDAM